MRIIVILILSISGFTCFSQGSLSYDYVPDATYEEVGDRISCIESEIPLNYNDRIKSFIDYFTIRDREYTRGVLNKSTYYFPMFEEYLARYNLPNSLKYLAVVESGLRANAESHASAVGLWQFIPSTGKMYGLQGDWYVDDRMDPEKATDAACRHLRDLYNMFDDWELAIAAYNCGPGNVRKAIRRSGYKRTFWEVYQYLPRETRSYLPQFVAIAYTFNYALEHNLNYEKSHKIQQIDTLLISQYFHLETFAKQTNLCLDDLLMLNPSIKRGALPEGTNNFALKIPADRKDTIVSRRQEIFEKAGSVGKEQLDYLARNTPGSTFGREKIVYKVRSGDVLGVIANRYNVRISDVRSWNNISGNLIRVGQPLAIWILPNYSASTKDLYASARTTVDQPKFADGQEKYKVRSGDTLWSIANAHVDLSIEKLKSMNQLRSNTIQPGQELIISTR
ncbi:MAG: LysM peptidoglycan-binding domain-containing protein [Cyclobacteriaceae bacterium]